VSGDRRPGSDRALSCMRAASSSRRKRLRTSLIGCDANWPGRVRSLGCSGHQGCAAGMRAVDPQRSLALSKYCAAARPLTDASPSRYAASQGTGSGMQFGQAKRREFITLLGGAAGSPSGRSRAAQSSRLVTDSCRYSKNAMKKITPSMAEPSNQMLPVGLRYQSRPLRPNQMIAPMIPATWIIGRQ
jgi:hypothetical protein